MTQSATSSTSGPIRLGLMTPYTGVVALYGDEIAIAAQIACDQINDAGGLLGRPLELIVIDDGSVPESAVPAAKQLVHTYGCHAIIGNLLSNSRIAVAAEVAEPLQVPYLNFSFYEGSISGRHFFHFAALPNQQIDHMIPYMVRRFGSKCYFAGSNYEWPIGSIDAAKRALQRCGGEVVGEEYFPLGEQQLDDLIGRVGRAGTDILVPYFAGSDQLHLLRRFHALGLKSRIAVVMGHFDEAMAQQLLPDEREGLFSCNSYFMSINTPENSRVLQRLAARPDIDGIWPDGNGIMTNFGEGAWICVQAFALAVRTAQSLQPERLLSALTRTALLAPQGRVVMDGATQHAAINSWLACCDRDGRMRIVERFGREPPQIPARYRNTPMVNRHDGVTQIDNHLESLTATTVNISQMSNDSDTTESIPDTANRGEPALATASVRDAAAASAARATPFADGATAELGVMVFDRAGIIRHVNLTMLQAWQQSATDLLGRTVASIWCDEQAWQRALERAASSTVPVRLVLPYCGSDGRRHDCVMRLDLDRNGFSIISCDILLSALRRNSDTVEQILALTDIAVIATDSHGRILHANRHAETLFGYEDQELIGLSVHLLVPPAFRERHATYLEQFIAGECDQIPMTQRGELGGYRKDGSQFPVEASLSRFVSDNGWVTVVSLRDIGERKRSEQHLLWRATHDDLTDLPNRALIQERLQNALSRSARDGQMVALLFIDLDGFKLINDSYGHAIGDQLLVSVSERLLNSVRRGDTVGRLSGDEFVIMCDQNVTVAAIEALAERLNSALRSPIRLHDQALVVTASIGIAFGSGRSHSADTMLREADAAMYHAKSGGRNSWQLFSGDMQAHARRRLELINGLHQALTEQQFSLRLQPIIASESETIVGMELLLRWQRGEEMISPAEFIPLAEESGSILEIGRWLVNEACRIAQQLRQRYGERAPYLALNLSVRQLGDTQLVAQFQQAMSHYQIAPEQLLLELTETGLMSDQQRDLDTLYQLAELGLKVAVDDFGTGYSSLSRLLRLPVSTIKIDKEFVDGVGRHGEHEVVVDAIVRMSRVLGLYTVAEGVESQDQARLLQSMGCSALQGYLYSRPLTEAALYDFVDQQQQGEQPNESTLFFTIYTSVGVENLSRATLSEILVTARQRNLAYQISGCLLYMDGTFLQLLEGPESAVREVMGSIDKDDRHHQIRIVTEGTTSQRLFQNWSMGFRDIGQDTLPVSASEAELNGVGLRMIASMPRLVYNLFRAISLGRGD